MTADDDGDAVERTVDLLGELGLTEYEAKCLVALTRIDHGTAKEVSEVADVPRARVYDSMDALRERGLADVQGAQPRRYRAVGTGETVARLRRDFEGRFDELSDLLPRLDPPESRGDGPGVWALEGDDAVSDRLASLVADADEELLLVIAVEGLLTDELLSALADATGRGVDVTVASPAVPVRETVAGAVPDADVRETWTWWETHPIRTGEVSSVLLADGRDLLVSSTMETALPDADRHAAVWSDDRNAPVVGVMRPLLAEAIGAT